MHARKRNSKLFGVLLSLLLVAALCVGGTLAYLKASDSPVTNTFTLADIHTHIEEDKGGNEESKKVSLTNPSTSTGPVWIRARVLVSSGTAKVIFVAAAPETKAENTIYVVIGSGWTKNDTDGYYYYNNLVAVNGKTTPLVNGVYAGAGVDAGTFDVIVSGEAVLGSAGGNAQAAFAKIN